MHFILNLQAVLVENINTYQYSSSVFLCFAKRQGKQYHDRILLCIYQVTADIPITITDTVITIPIESTCITAIIPITA